MPQVRELVGRQRTVGNAELVNKAFVTHAHLQSVGTEPIIDDTVERSFAALGVIDICDDIRLTGVRPARLEDGGHMMPLSVKDVSAGTNSQSFPDDIPGIVGTHSDIEIEIYNGISRLAGTVYENKLPDVLTLVIAVVAQQGRLGTPGHLMTRRRLHPELNRPRHARHTVGRHRHGIGFKKIGGNTGIDASAPQCAGWIVGIAGERNRLVIML